MAKYIKEQGLAVLVVCLIGYVCAMAFTRTLVEVSLFPAAHGWDGSEPGFHMIWVEGRGATLSGWGQKGQLATPSLPLASPSSKNAVQDTHPPKTYGSFLGIGNHGYERARQTCAEKVLKMAEKRNLTW